MDFLIAGVVALTSASAYVIASRWLGLPSAGLWMAIRRLLECLGTAAIFTVVNLSAAAAVILIARVLAGHFMSADLLDDVVWLVVSTLQGLTWALWRQAGLGPAPAPPQGAARRAGSRLACRAPLTPMIPLIAPPS